VHEMALAESMLQLVEETAKNNGATRVTAVRLELGALSHVERDALCFCFDAVTKGGVAHGAVLEIDATPGAAWCMCCSARVPLAQVGDPCPLCGGWQLTVVQGEEMRVREIEIA
jgi:hydrogenase nickel incorporation protein HypA/HybF